MQVFSKKDKKQNTNYFLDFIKSLLEIVSEIEKKYLLYFLFLFLFELPYIAYYSKSFSYTICRGGADELVFLRVISRILTSHSYSDLYAFAYGSTYWLISSALVFPFWLAQNEQGMIITLRVLSLLSSLGSFLIILKILTNLDIKKYIILIIVTFCFFIPINIRFATLIYPQTIYNFFICLSFYFLHKDASSLKKYYYYSIFVFTIAVSIKTLSAPYAIVYLVYYFYNYDKVNSKILGKSALLFSGTFIALNPAFLLSHKTLIKYLKDVSIQSEIARHGWLNNSYGLNFTRLPSSYINFYSFIILMLTSLWFLHLTRREQKNDQIVYFVSSLFVIMFYFLFCNLYAASPGHYGMTLIFFVPFVIGYIIKNSSYNKRTRIVSYIVFFSIFMLNINTIKP